MPVPPDVDRRFHEAAEREGLVDVAYDVTESPVGELLGDDLAQQGLVLDQQEMFRGIRHLARLPVF